MSLHGGSSTCYLYALRGNADKSVGLPSALCCPTVPAPCTCSARQGRSNTLSLSISISLSPNLPLYLSLRQLNAALSMRMPKRAAIRGRSCAANWPIGGSICQLELLANTAQQGCASNTRQEFIRENQNRFPCRAV